MAAGARTRWSALAASALIQCFAGASYCFGIYSPALKSSQGYDQSQLDTVAFFKDVGANAGVLSGLLAAWAPGGLRRPWVVLLVGATLFTAGYLPMWLAVAGVAPAPLPLMCFYMLLAAQSQTFLNTANVVTAAENFPDRRGTVIGIMKGFLGLSGAILVQVQHALHIDPGNFILMLAILPTAITLMVIYFVDVHKAHLQYNKKFLDAFSLNAVTVAGYLMVFIICDQVFVISSAMQSIFFTILLLLIMSPVAVVVKAQKTELKQQEEACLEEERTGLLCEETVENSENALVGSGQDMSPDKENLNLVQAMCKINFWLLFLAMACGMGSGMATVNNISQIGASLGYTSREISTLVSLWSIWNFSGRFGAGYISDHFLRSRGVARPFFMAATLLVMSVGHAIIASGLPASLYIGSVLVGLCYGSQWSLMPTITSEIFGLNHFATIFYTVAVASPVGSYILSVRVIGYIYDKETPRGELACIGKHCFALSFMIMTCVCIFGSAVAFLLFIRTRKFYRQVIYARLMPFVEE